MKKNGFTLLELIIVIIILGVLASLALPRMFSMVNKIKAKEAIESLSLIDKGIQGCLEFGRGGPASSILPSCLAYVNGGNFTALGINNPATEISAHFTYFSPGNQASAADFGYIYAISATLVGGGGSDVIVLFRRNLNIAGIYVHPCGASSPAVNEGVKIQGCGVFRSIRMDNTS